MLASFQLYGPKHLLTLLFLFLLASFIITLFRKDQLHLHPHLKPKDISSTRSKITLYLLAFLCFISVPFSLMSAFMVGSAPAIIDSLPLQLCDIITILCGIALITKNPLLCELSYFWGLTGTLQGILTPDISYEFPDPDYISFFLQHGVIVITAIVLPLGLGWRPRKGAVMRVYKWLLLYAISIFFIDVTIHANYAFVMEKPHGASLLDILGDWPWYILWTLLIALVLFFLLNLPFTKKKTPNTPKSL